MRVSAVPLALPWMRARNVFVADSGNQGGKRDSRSKKVLHQAQLCQETLGGGFSFSSRWRCGGRERQRLRRRYRQQCGERDSGGGRLHHGQQLGQRLQLSLWRRGGRSGNVFVADAGKQCGEGDSGGGRLHHGQHLGQRLTQSLGVAVDGTETSSSPDCGNNAVKEILPAGAVYAELRWPIGRRRS